MSRQPKVPLGMFDSPCLRLLRRLGRLTCKFLLLLTAVAPVALSAGVTNYVWDGNGVRPTRYQPPTPLEVLRTRSLLLLARPDWRQQ
jgi:hypothetical protein